MAASYIQLAAERALHGETACRFAQYASWAEPPRHTSRWWRAFVHCAPGIYTEYAMGNLECMTKVKGAVMTQTDLADTISGIRYIVPTPMYDAYSDEFKYAYTTYTHAHMRTQDTMQKILAVAPPTRLAMRHACIRHGGGCTRALDREGVPVRYYEIKLVAQGRAADMEHTVKQALLALGPYVELISADTPWTTPMPDGDEQAFVATLIIHTAPRRVEDYIPGEYTSEYVKTITAFHALVTGKTKLRMRCSITPVFYAYDPDYRSTPCKIDPEEDEVRMSHTQNMFSVPTADHISLLYHLILAQMIERYETCAYVTPLPATYTEQEPGSLDPELYVVQTYDRMRSLAQILLGRAIDAAAILPNAICIAKAARISFADTIAEHSTDWNTEFYHPHRYGAYIRHTAFTFPEVTHDVLAGCFASFIVRLRIICTARIYESASNSDTDLRVLQLALSPPNITTVFSTKQVALSKKPARKRKHTSASGASGPAS